MLNNSHNLSSMLFTQLDAIVNGTINGCDLIHAVASMHLSDKNKATITVSSCSYKLISNWLNSQSI